MVCNYTAEMIHFVLTAKPKFSVSLMLFLLTLPLTFDFIHSLPPSGSPTFYWSHHCSNDSIRNGSALQRNLKVVINSVLDNVNKTGYSESSYGENGDKMFGFTQCRGDLNASACRGCVSKAIEHLAVDCNGSLSYGSVSLSGCVLTYATHMLSSESNASYSSHALFALCDNITINGTEARGVKDWKTASLLSRLIEKAVSSNIGYSTLSDYGVYSVAECGRESTMSECSRCLNSMYNYLGSCPAGTSQGLADFDNCVIRFDSYKFYDDGVPLLSALNGSGNKSGPSIPASRPSRPTQGKRLAKVLGLSIGGAVVVVVLLGLVVFWKRKVNNPSNRKPLPGKII